MSSKVLAFVILCVLMPFTLQGVAKDFAERDNEAWKEGFDLTDDSREVFNISGILFYVSRYATNYNAAITECARFNLKLVSVESEEKQQFIEEVLLHYPPSRGTMYNTYWTSGLRLADTTDFIWNSTGNAFTYTNWYEGNPDQSLSMTAAVVIGWEYVSERQWYDTDINSFGYYFLCEE